jgi:hypothetical protein
LEIAQQAGVFAVAIDATRLNIGIGGVAGGQVIDDLLPRDELERRAILQLINDQPLWDLHEERQTFADLFYELKGLVEGGQTGEIIASKIGASPLVEKVRLARAAAASPAAPSTNPGTNTGEVL